MSKECLYSGRIVGLERHEVELADGRRSVREVVRHGPAVAVVAERPDGRFALVRQFRKPLECAVLEIVAGHAEPGETLEENAVREVREETGYEAVSIRRLGAVYPSPGYVDERIEIFRAQLSAEPVGIDPDEDEEVELLFVTREELLALIDSEAIQDAKTLAAWLMYERDCARVAQGDAL